MHGVEKGLGICLSREESYLLANYIDKDGDGHITFNEFNEKIHVVNYMQKS
jgi:Ca2+-binding EF-hand superfamily protein